MKNNIKLAREKSGMTQKDCAEKLGITLRAWQTYEQGVSEPKQELLCKIADMFSSSLDYLLGREPAPDPIKQLTNEQLEQKLVEGYFKLPKEYRETFLDGLRQAVMECCPDYAPPSPEPEPDNLIIDDVKKEWQAQGIGQK